MKIRDILNKDTETLSFEVFPPKKSTDFGNVEAAALGIAALQPAYMSVTYGAGGSTKGHTIALAGDIQKQYNVPTVAHLTCVCADRSSCLLYTSFTVAFLDIYMKGLSGMDAAKELRKTDADCFLIFTTTSTDHALEGFQAVSYTHLDVYKRQARTVAWLRKVFPNTEFDYVNAGIGATNSQFGAARVQEDLLCRLPDLVMVEFSVNDHCTPHDMETYEGLIRQIYGSRSCPAMVLLHSVYYDTGKSAAYYHAQIGRHYDLPCISMQNSIYPAVAAGRLPAEKITADFLHPNDLGHEFMVAVIMNFLEKVIHDKTEEQQEIFPAPRCV